MRFDLQVAQVTAAIGKALIIGRDVGWHAWGMEPGIPVNLGKGCSIDAVMKVVEEKGAPLRRRNGSPSKAGHMRLEEWFKKCSPNEFFEIVEKGIAFFIRHGRKCIIRIWRLRCHQHMPLI